MSKFWWTAFSPAGANGEYRDSIITVLASDREDAERTVEAELSKPGRGAHLIRWINSGRQLARKEND